MCALGMWGCGRPASAPMASIRLPLEPVRTHERLLVMLPGVSDHADIFFKHGFQHDLRKAGIQADIRFIDTRLRYYTQHEIVGRLRREVLEPARRAGYCEIWLVGASIGGFAALYTAKEHPELVDGMVVFSPFLGRMATTAKIRRAGGLTAWRAPQENRDFTVRLWEWLQGYAQPGEARPPLYLAYGARENDVYWGYSLLAEALPREHVVTHQGIHGWKSWKPMWPKLIARAWGGAPSPSQGETSVGCDDAGEDDA